MKPLYAITNDLQAAAAAIDAACDDTGGELPADLEALLDGIQMDFASKVDGICRVMRNLQAAGAMYMQEVDRLRAAADRLQRAHDRLKAYILACMLRAKLPRVETPLFKVRVQRNSQPAVTCDVPIDPVVVCTLADAGPKEFHIRDRGASQVYL